MEYQNLRFLQDAFLKTQHVCSWTLTEDGQLLFSNCPEQEFFWNLFRLGSCEQTIREHFAQTEAPILAADSIGFVWIAVRQKTGDGEEIPLLQLLGPIFLSTVTEAHLRQRLQRLRATLQQENRLLELVKPVPAMTSESALQLACMLHYCVNGIAIRPEHAILRYEDAAKEEELYWGNSNWHGTWIAEQRFFQSMMEGRAEGIRELSVGRVGNIGGGDPLRQAKNEMIVFSVLCSRAAILGGVSSEGALNLEDYYIQEVEAAETVQEVFQIGSAMHRSYIDRVQKAKSNGGQSPMVRAVAEYVQTHILERIRVKDIADEIGYTENYISSVFKAETGGSLMEYINRQKIEMAKLIMDDNKLPIAVLSDRLAFSNPSYFSAVFKKVTGMTPAEYQEKNKIKHTGGTTHVSEELHSDGSTDPGEGRGASRQNDSQGEGHASQRQLEDDPGRRGLQAYL